MPVIEVFEPKELGPKSWGREMLVARTSTTMAKVLYMNAGHAGPLQFHERKDECFYLLSGQAWVSSMRSGKLDRELMNPGQSFYIPPGAVHKVEAITDCVLIESSNVVFDDRVAVE